MALSSDEKGRIGHQGGQDTKGLWMPSARGFYGGEFGQARDDLHGISTEIVCLWQFVRLQKMIPFKTMDVRSACKMFFSAAPHDLDTTRRNILQRSLPSVDDLFD